MNPRETVPEWQVAEVEGVPGWDWNGRRAKFRRNLEALRQFCDEYGTTDIPFEEKVTFYEFEIKLQVWVNNMRARNRKGDLPSWQAAELEAILGPRWSDARERGYGPPEESWSMPPETIPASDAIS
jgi:hypothetical protein